MRVTPTTGGGFYSGLLRGALAAEVVADGLKRDRLQANALKIYESGWLRKLGAEIKVVLAFRRVAVRLSDESIDALIELARGDGVGPLLQEHPSFHWHRKAALALLAHPAFRKIVYKSWTRSAGPI